MKKLMIMLCAACLLFVAVPAFSVLAAENEGEPTNVNITVVMPEIVMPPTEEPAPTPPAEIKVFPSNVEEVRENGGWQIIRTYVLRADESPQDIPRESFMRSGWEFNLTDIIRRETANAGSEESVRYQRVRKQHARYLQSADRRRSETTRFIRADGTRSRRQRRCRRTRLEAVQNP